MLTDVHTVYCFSSWPPACSFLLWLKKWLLAKQLTSATNFLHVGLSAPQRSANSLLVVCSAKLKLSYEKTFLSPIIWNVSVTVCLFVCLDRIPSSRSSSLLCCFGPFLLCCPPLSTTRPSSRLTGPGRVLQYTRVLQYARVLQYTRGLRYNRLLQYTTVLQFTIFIHRSYVFILSQRAASTGQSLSSHSHKSVIRHASVCRSGENRTTMHKCYTFLIFMVLLLPSLGLSR